MFDCSSQDVCSEKIKLFKTLNLVAKTVVWKVDIGSNINSPLKNRTNDFEWFPLAPYEGTNVTDTVEVFTQGANADFEATEKMSSSKQSTWHNYLWKCIQKCWEITYSVQPEEESTKMYYNW